MTVLTDMTGVRGITSALARCTRQAAYKALGAEEEPAPYDMQEFWRRGQVFERLRVSEYEAAHGREKVQRHRVVLWRAAGHEFAGQMDAYLPDTATVVEIVSAVSPSALTVEQKIEQNAVYQVLDPEAEKGVVDVIDPSRLAPADTYPVRVTDEHRAEILERIERFEIALQGGDLPPRVCGKPSEARQRYCPFASTCFAGWQEPEHDVDSPEARRLAAELLALDRARREAKAVVAELDGRWRDVTGELAELVPAGKTHLGAVTVTRTPVAGRVTFGLSTARKAGYWTPQDEERFEAFLRRGEPHERWSVVRDGEGPLVDADDYGEVPF